VIADRLLPPALPEIQQAAKLSIIPLLSIKPTSVKLRRLGLPRPPGRAGHPSPMPFISNHAAAGSLLAIFTGVPDPVSSRGVPGQAPAGSLAVSVLRDAERAFWTRTVWREEAAMRGFMQSRLHRRVMAASRNGAMRPPWSIGYRMPTSRQTGAEAHRGFQRRAGVRGSVTHMKDAEMEAETEDFLEGFNQPTYCGMRVNGVRVATWSSQHGWSGDSQPEFER
jgi:hypothetical protein